MLDCGRNYFVRCSGCILPSNIDLNRTKSPPPVSTETTSLNRKVLTGLGLLGAIRILGQLGLYGFGRDSGWQVPSRAPFCRFNQSFIVHPGRFLHV